jgi:periplasmic protein CpxP/Spy
MNCQINLGPLRTGVAIAILGIASIATANAQGPDGPPPGMGPHRPPMERALGMHGDHGRWWNEPRAIEKLKLTDTQRKSMDDIYQQHRLTLIDLHATLEKAEVAMEPLMQESQPDEGKILSQIDRIAQARAELEKANARMLLGLRKELTPEQWKQIQTERAARREGQGPGQGPDGQHKWHGRPGGGAPGQGGPASGGPGGGGGPSAESPDGPSFEE